MTLEFLAFKCSDSDVHYLLVNILNSRTHNYLRKKAESAGFIFQWAVVDCDPNNIGFRPGPYCELDLCQFISL